MERHEVERFTGIHTVVAQDVCRLLQSMLSTPWLAPHSCKVASKNECPHCELGIVWHQLSLQLVEYIAPENLAHPPDVSYSYNDKIINLFILITFVSEIP